MMEENLPVMVEKGEKYDTYRKCESRQYLYRREGSLYTFSRAIIDHIRNSFINMCVLLRSIFPCEESWVLIYLYLFVPHLIALTDKH